MELSNINALYSRSLNVLSELQKQSSQNLANIATNSGKVSRSKFERIMSSISTSTSREKIAELVASKSELHEPSVMRLANEMAVTQSIAGKYELISAIYSQQLALYKLAVKGRAS